jgi:hypothetical protein
MDRRTYIKQLALVTGGAFILPRIIVSCGENAPDLPIRSSLEPFRTLEEIRHFVRMSTGYLKLEVDRLIEKKDPEAIFQFVNERIVTIPAQGSSITSNAYEVRWGMKGMLRCGKGTLREKSDLLFFMLKEAGFSPMYFRASFLMTPALVNQVFCRSWVENNEIEVAEEYIEKWDESLTTTSEIPVPKEVDLSHEKSKELARQLSEQLPDGFEEAMPNIDWLNVDSIEAPVVRIEFNGEQKDLNFVEPKSFSEFGSSELTLYDLSSDETQSNLNKVRVILKATFSDRLNDPQEIARGEWKLQELIGQQVSVQCISTIPQQQLLQTTLKDVQQFLPVFSLQNPELSAEEKTKHSFKGVGFDLMGNTFEEDDDGAIRMNGLILNEVEETTDQVRSLKVELLSNEYPTIKLRCAPLDSAGKPVLGLSGNAFRIVDQQKEQSPVVLQNTFVGRILVYYDATSSMPYPYAAGSIPEELHTEIQKNFESIFPTVVTEVKTYQLDFLDGLALLELSAYDHVLCIGDGEAFDGVSSEELSQIIGENSISYHYVKNGASGQSFDQVKTCFEGANHLFGFMENLEGDIEKLKTRLQNQTQFPYLLSYEAPIEGDDFIHPVSIEINQNTQVKPVEKRYVVDRERKYDASRFPCGISITLEWDEGYSYKSITKHIAGFNPKTDRNVLPKHKEAIRSFALGTHRFFFEADKATLPALLDQSISSQLSVASLFDDPNESTSDQLEQVNQFEVLPVEGLSVFAPLPSAEKDTITFENNFQTCFYSEYVNFDEQKFFRKIDVWETSDVRTFAPTSREAFRRNLEATSRLAMSEASLFADSTFNQLKNKSVRLYIDGDVDFQKHPAFQVFYDQVYLNHLIYDPSLTSQAYWKINKSTGAIIGIMTDGSGGGIEESVALNLKIIDSYAGAYNKAAAPLMSDPLAFGTVTMYGQFLARLYGLVCVAVVSMDAAELPVKSRKALKKLAYGVIKSFAFAKFSKLKNFEKILDKLFDPGWPDVKK